MLDKGTGVKNWKERGVGDIRFLRCEYSNHSPILKRLLLFNFRHKENSRIRVLMRQEKTLKIIVNSFLDPRIVLSPNAGNDKSWVWVAFDFAEGELLETVSS
jgi:hypothetical protein